MDEYVERRAVHDAVTDAIWHGKWSMYDVASAINSVPNADVAPVRHAKWGVEVGMNFYKERNCPVCKKRIESNFWSYCPNCGTRMDGELNE